MEEKKPWYKNKLYLTGAILLAGLMIIGSFDNTSSSNTVQPVIQPISNQGTTPNVPLQKINTIDSTPTPKVNSTPQAQSEDKGLSNDNYYTNTAGNEVHSPAYSNSVPAGASAQCRDGTYSFSQSRRGTCSHHGGVAEWL